MDFLEDLLGRVGQTLLENFIRDVKPRPRPELSLVVKCTDRVIPVDAEVFWRIEEHSRWALVVATPIHFGIPVGIRPAMMVAIAVDGDRTMLRLCRMWLEDCDGHQNGISDPILCKECRFESLRLSCRA